MNTPTLSVKCLLLLALSAYAAVPPGLSNPAGYLVQTYYTYSGCNDDYNPKQEVMATAINVCIDSSVSLRGEPYSSSHYTYTFGAAGSVDVTLYNDDLCEDFLQIYEVIDIDSCSTAGDSAYTTYSAQLPSLHLRGAVVQQVVYTFDSDAYTQPACDHENDIVLTYALYTEECRINCRYQGYQLLTCEFPSCVNETVNITYSSDEDDDTCAVPIAATLVSTNCAETITCVDPSNSSGNDDLLSGWEIAVIVIVAVAVVGAVVAGGAYYYYYFVSRTAPLAGPSSDGPLSVALTA